MVFGAPASRATDSAGELGRRSVTDAGKTGASTPAQLVVPLLATFQGSKSDCCAIGADATDLVGAGRLARLRARWLTRSARSAGPGKLAG